MEDNIILEQVANLHNIPTAELRKIWLELFETPPPIYNKSTLINKLSYRIQELHFGGLKKSTRKELRDRSVEQKISKRKPIEKPVTGTRLVREFGGKMHSVTVLTNGFEYEGRKYKSLTALAMHITGMRWSGPSFFGLKRYRNKKHEE